MSRYQEQLQTLAMEQDPDKRLELASGIDADADDLESNWGNRDEATRLSGELETAVRERDEARATAADWQKKYADRFFDNGTNPEQINKGMKKDIKTESRPQSYDDLWAERG